MKRITLASTLFDKTTWAEISTHTRYTLSEGEKVSWREREDSCPRVKLNKWNILPDLWKGDLARETMLFFQESLSENIGQEYLGKENR